MPPRAGVEENERIIGFPFYIARRYLFARKSRNIINVITAISVVVIAFVTMAMVAILSAFNGIDELVDDLYSSFDADIMIRPSRGKLMTNDSLDIAAITALPEVISLSEVIEERMLLSYDDKQRIATIKGVYPDYIRDNMVGSIREGSDLLTYDDKEWIVIGLGIAMEIEAQLFSDGMRPLYLYAPVKGKKLSRDREGAFRSEPIRIGGVFSINVEYDTKYALTSLAFARELMGYTDEFNYLELSLGEEDDPVVVEQKIMAITGDAYEVVTRREKNALIYQANETERTVTILILSFIIVIAIFNILASLTMLILDKRKDIHILHSMGATEDSIRQIFFTEGIMISALGTVIGIVLGLILTWLQTTIGLVPLQGGIVDFYPVIVKWQDVLMVAAIVTGIAVVFSFFPVRLLTKRVMAED